MALNPDRITFLLQQIKNSEYRTFRSTVAQLFTYLSQEVKDNPIYDKFEKEREKWSDWPKEEASFGHGQWDFPDSLDDAKSLA